MDCSWTRLRSLAPTCFHVSEKKRRRPISFSHGKCNNLNNSEAVVSDIGKSTSSTAGQLSVMITTVSKKKQSFGSRTIFGCF